MLSQTLPRLASQLIVNKKSSRNRLLQELFWNKKYAKNL